jgi:hypothetical protein
MDTYADDLAELVQKLAMRVHWSIAELA